LLFGLKNTSRNILLINYGFPPFPGIGGRRWALFAKNLEKSGYHVFVIGASNPFNYNSSWNIGIRQLSGYYPLNINYPKSLITFPPGLYGKIKYKIGLSLVKFKHRGNPYDRTVFWRSQLQDKIKEIVKQKDIKTIIVSAAPFSLLTHVNELIPDYPKVKFIADIRDPWTTNVNAYGYSGLSKSRFDYELNMEKKCMSNYNLILTVNSTLTSYFQQLYPMHNCVTLPNGFEEDFFHTGTNLIKLESEKVNIVFTGSFYDNAFYLFRNLIDTISQLKNNSRVKFYFIGSNFESLVKYVSNSNVKDLFYFDKVASSAEVDLVLQQATYSMLFLTDDINYSLSTKFCEYIKHRKPILLFSKEGFTSNYIIDNDLGWHVTDDNINQVLDQIISGPEKVFPNNFDVNQFSVGKITEDLINLLND
jgi:glycosyltransferase involved in cell wall biosynthesis